MFRCPRRTRSGSLQISNYSVSDFFQSMYFQATPNARLGFNGITSARGFPIDITPQTNFINFVVNRLDCFEVPHEMPAKPAHSSPRQQRLLRQQRNVCRVAPRKKTQEMPRRDAARFRSGVMEASERPICRGTITDCNRNRFPRGILSERSIGERRELWSAHALTIVA